MSKEEALRIIKEESGAQFDPALVDLFIQLMSHNCGARHHTYLAPNLFYCEKLL